MTETASIRVGICLFGVVRRYLQEQRFIHEDFEWFESSGWLCRVFVVKGSPERIAAIARDWAEWERLLA